MARRLRNRPEPRANESTKHQDENTKHQAPNTRKAPNLKLQYDGVNVPTAVIGIWGVGISLELGVWCLVFGVSATSH
jgi:hypothetical protein